MKCIKCGSTNPDGSLKCKSCGEQIAAGSSGEASVITDSGKYLLNDLIINNRFKIMKRLGKGGMGQIFLAEDIKLKRKVAIKSISTTSLADPASKARFLREAQTASQLEHSNICTIYEIYEEGDSDYIVMQYIDGVTLDHIIKLKKLGTTRILDIAIQICNGMIEAHAKDIVHRDIKPANLMVDNKGIVKVLDFGLAKFQDRAFLKQDGVVDSNLTEKGIVLGTVAYMSPEQARGKNLDQRSDLFSFGVVLYEMITGENPFMDREQIITLYNVLNKDVEFADTVPQELQKIVGKLLQKEKKDRFRDFSQLKEALENFQSVYKEDKKKKPVEDKTEVINYEEKEKLLKEMRSTSDHEELGEIVNRIKKLKAYTQPIFSTRRKSVRYILIPVAILSLALLSVFFIFKGKGGAPLVTQSDKFFVYLHKFDNKTKDKDLAAKLHLLLNESLNQFQEFKVIDKEMALAYLDVEEKNLRISQLKPKYNVLFELRGEIIREDKIYEITARLIPLDKKNKPPPPITGMGSQNINSVLNSQVDQVSEGVYHKLFSANKGNVLAFKKTAKMFGRDWKAFGNFFTGLKHYKKLQISESIKYLEKAQTVLLAKYFLADLNYFSGDRKQALDLINKISERLEDLPELYRLKVEALQARLKFNFPEEEKKLLDIEKKYGFLKETYYDLGEAYFHHGYASKARDYYLKAIELDKKYSKAINHLGYCFSHMGQHIDASHRFERYKTLDETANSYDSLGDGYFYDGQLNRTQAYKTKAIRNDSKGMIWSYLTLADVYTLKADFEIARGYLATYKKIRGTPRDISRALIKEAFLFYHNLQLKEALQAINQSIEAYDSDNINENSAEARWLKGIILIAQGKIGEAKLELEWLKQVSEKYELSKENFSAPYKYYVHLEALVLEKENNVAEADKRFRSLLEMKEQLSFQITFYHYQFFHTDYTRFLIRNKKYQEALGEINLCLGFSHRYIPALWAKADILEILKDNSRFDIYKQIQELYQAEDGSMSSAKNYWRSLLRLKLKNRPPQSSN